MSAVEAILSNNMNAAPPFDDDAEIRLSGLALFVMSVLMLAAFVVVGLLSFYQYEINQASLRAEPSLVAASAVPETANSENFENAPGNNPTPRPLHNAPVSNQVLDAASHSEAAPVEIADLVENAGPMPPSPANDIAAQSSSDNAPAKPAFVTERTMPPAPIDALAGNHVVQVGAFESNEIAQDRWATIEAALGEILTGKSHDIECADLGEIGVFYRLRIGPFFSSDEAREYCNRLSARSQDCLAMRL